MKKRLLSLALALVMALALVPAASAGDISMGIPSLLEQGVPSRYYDYADARIPVKINAPYIEPDIPEAPDGLCDDILRISYVVSQETMTCDGEALEVYTIYSGSFIWRNAFPGDEYSVGSIYCQFFMADESVPAVSDAPAMSTNTAYASTQTVNVDGKAVTFECYALKDANGNATNYIKLRDLAMLLNGSAAQFQVGWDGSVTITTNGGIYQIYGG